MNKTHCHSCGGPLPARGENCVYCGNVIPGRSLTMPAPTPCDRKDAVVWFEDQLLPEFDEGPLTAILCRMDRTHGMLTGVQD
jgi:hypothetical protein